MDTEALDGWACLFLLAWFNKVSDDCNCWKPVASASVFGMFRKQTIVSVCEHLLTVCMCCMDKNNPR